MSYAEDMDRYHRLVTEALAGRAPDVSQRRRIVELVMKIITTARSDGYEAGYNEGWDEGNNVGWAEGAGDV